MNAHDSEKVVGTLLHSGYTQVETAGRGGPGRLQHLQHPRQGRAEGVPPARSVQARGGKGKMFAVLGCVAQQEGERIFEKAPHVSLVAGSASYTKLPGDAGAARSRQPPRHRTEPRYRGDVRHAVHAPRQSAPRLHHHHRRLRQILRLLRGPFHARSGAQPHQRERDAGSRELAGAGYTEVQLLGPEREQLSRSVAGRLGFRHAARPRGPRFRASAACASPPRIRAIS